MAKTAVDFSPHPTPPAPFSFPPASSFRFNSQQVFQIFIYIPMQMETEIQCIHSQATNT